MEDTHQQTAIDDPPEEIKLESQPLKFKILLFALF